MDSRWEKHPCACSFGKTVDDRNPYHFPRVGMVDNVLYRGSWMIKHTGTERVAIISRPHDGPLCAEADVCCHDWFTEDQPHD